MEKVKIGNMEDLYEIELIQQVAANILQLMFVGRVPDAWGDISVYTDGDVLAATLSGWDTVYQEDGQTVYLSNDGSTYAPSSELPEEPYTPVLEELREAKKLEVSGACKAVIRAGVGVTLSDKTTVQFALTTEDQLNLLGKQVQLAAGAGQLEYHADGRPCRYYSASDMQLIINAAMRHVSYHTTYCNALDMWIAGCQTEEELEVVYYGADIPEEYQSDVLRTYLTTMDGTKKLGKEDVPNAVG